MRFYARDLNGYWIVFHLFFRRMRKSHAIILHFFKIATHLFLLFQ